MLLRHLLLPGMLFCSLHGLLHAAQEQLLRPPVVSKKRIATLSEAVPHVSNEAGVLVDLDYTLLNPITGKEIEGGTCPLLGPDTGGAFVQMKKAAAYIVALTARSNCQALATQCNLENQKLRFSKFEHLPEDKGLGPVTDSSEKKDEVMYYKSGLVCTNGLDKGLAFLAFMNHWPDDKPVPPKLVVVDDQEGWLHGFVDALSVESFKKYKERWPKAINRLAKECTSIRLLHMQPVPHIIESPFPITDPQGPQLRAKGVIYHLQTANSSVPSELQGFASWFARIKKGDPHVVKDTPFVAHTLLEALLLVFEKPLSAKANHVAVFTDDPELVKDVRNLFEDDSFKSFSPYALLRLRSVWTLTFYPWPKLLQISYV